MPQLSPIMWIFFPLIMMFVVMCVSVLIYNEVVVNYEELESMEGGSIKEMSW